MLHHIVMIKFKPETGDEQISALESRLDALPDQIIEIQLYDFGRDVVHSERSYDFALVSGFANRDAMKRYQVHPAHQKVVAYIREISDDILAVDFETHYRAPANMVEPDPFKGFKMP
ncbi:MAG: Dabb family protein [Desulfosarcina sp.]|nr:Dabb family protein [Desulfobacterales bacterium]